MKNAGWDHVHVGELKRYSFSTWPFLFSCVSTTFWGICPANNGPFTEAPDEIYRVGLLASMFMGHNSDSHFPLHRDLLYFLMHPKHRPQCLEHRKCSVDICWTDDPGMETNGGLPPVLEAGAGPCGLRSCGQPHSVRETEGPGRRRPRLGEIWRARPWAASHGISTSCSQAFPSCKPLSLNKSLCLCFN